MNILFKTLIITLGIAFIPAALALPTQENNSMLFRVNQNQMVFDHTTIESATIDTSEEKNQTYAINLKIRSTAINEFENLIQKNIGAKAEIILNGKVISSATIRGQLGREIMITGLTKEEAEEFLLSLKLTNMEQAEQKASNTTCSSHSKLCQAPLDLK